LYSDSIRVQSEGYPYIQVIVFIFLLLSLNVLLPLQDSSTWTLTLFFACLSSSILFSELLRFFSVLVFLRTLPSQMYLPFSFLLSPLPFDQIQWILGIDLHLNKVQMFHSLIQLNFWQWKALVHFPRLFVPHPLE